MELMLLSDLHGSLDVSSLNKKRWRKAFATIYCSIAFLSPFKNLLSSSTNQIHKFSKDSRKISPEPSSRIVIDIEQQLPFFSSIDHSTLNNLVKEKSLDRLAKLGGVEGLAASLKTDEHNGISGDQQDIVARYEAFGRNTYQMPPTKSFFHFVWEAFKDPTILILLICAALSLGFGIKEHDPKDGWYDGGSIFVAVFLVIAVSAISNFRQNKQFDKLSKVSSNIPVEVVRNGRRQQISIFEVVVGEVVCLKIGDQVPADGLFIDGHSLQVDESSMTGESDHVEIDRDANPFLFSGTKVADGYRKMVVISVELIAKMVP
ncbi:ATPase E1-E2 type family protein / haloacid dehalogenase-like hydrolase family protein [Perilla frutescens var. hirtella]|uniref:ATPase E1-E2 type family protein / haloacid dehalogenase-like hydrolase family protein n=1 Tax=Perilla frutescens var. hirtella TaxID=608512 RepID=A0AAD4IUN0_PERFH|nr:ATPase E1-E2 type family protein / haloacid dehalogenase-like hydrolase family protein [Perilla frutescens var. hirtella]